MKRPLQRAERPQHGGKGATGGIEPWTCSTPCAQDTSPHSLRKLQALQQHPSEPHLSPPPASDSDSARVQDWTRVPT